MKGSIPGLAIVLAVAWAAAAAEGPGIRVHVPAADSIVSGGGNIHVVVEIEAGVAPSVVRARLNGTDLGPGTHQPRSGGGGVLHWSAQLAPGQNLVEVESSPPGKPAVREARALYFSAAILSASDPPKGFKRVPFHQARAEAPPVGMWPWYRP